VIEMVGWKKTKKKKKMKKKKKFEYLQVEESVVGVVVPLSLLSLFVSYYCY
jgi:hypothetical protein